MDRLTRDAFVDDSAEAGLFWSEFTNALSIWAAMQPSPPTVVHAAYIFNTEPDVIREAVDEHCWMFLAGAGDLATIEHDGL